MKRLLIHGVFVLAAVGQDVQHAPTVAQCQADQRLWDAKLEEGDSPKVPTFDILVARESEMLDCQTVDSDHKAKYQHTEITIGGIEDLRLGHFLLRHKLSKQFMNEDAAGQR